MKSIQVKAIRICLKGKNVQKNMFYQNAKITQFKYQKQSIRNKIKKTNNKIKVVAGAYLQKKNLGYIIPTENCYPRNVQLRDPDFRRHKLYHPQSVPIFATSHLVACIKYHYNSLEDKVDKSTVATSYQLGQIDYTLQNIIGQNFWQYKIQIAKILQ